MQQHDQTAGQTAPRDLSTTEVFIQIGTITRLLHDTLSQLGVMPKLRLSAEGLPDARSRLSYIAQKTGDAAEKVLNAVDLAKQDHADISAAARKLAAEMSGDKAAAASAAGVLAFVAQVEAASGRMDQHLTDIMMAQDFHDLTGQVVAKVVALAIDLEDSLVKLLVQAAPSELASEPTQSELNGPVVNPEGRTDIVSNQSEVDDLLASLGF
jgi:chemotaxis protein CheZ